MSLCMYSSGEMWVWLRVTVIHDMRSSNKICIYFSGIEVSISQDLQSVICNYFSGGKCIGTVGVGVSIIHDLR